jgi:hypothetical protein
LPSAIAAEEKPMTATQAKAMKEVNERIIPHPTDVIREF